MDAQKEQETAETEASSTTTTPQKKKRHTKLQNWIDEADEKWHNENDDSMWTQMVEDARGENRLTEEQFKVKYEFSVGAGLDAAAKRGFYEKQVRATSSTNATQEIRFTIDVNGEEPSFKKSTSVQIYDDIAARLEKVYDEYWQYSHRAILNKLIDEGLKKYEF